MAPLDAADQVMALLARLEELLVDLRQLAKTMTEEQTSVDDATPRT